MHVIQAIPSAASSTSASVFLDFNDLDIYGFLVEKERRSFYKQILLSFQSHIDMSYRTAGYSLLKHQG